jgi:tetratricopeptide (TPR) repeat protein
MSRIKFILLLLCLGVMNAQAQEAMKYGRAYLAEGDNAAAARSYSEQLNLNPFDAVAHNNLAVAKAAQGDYQSAMDLLQRAVKLAPNRADISDNLRRLQSWMSQENAVQTAAINHPVWHKKSSEFLELPAIWGSDHHTTEIHPQLKLIKQLRNAPNASR